MRNSGESSFVLTAATVSGRIFYTDILSNGYFRGHREVVVRVQVSKLSLSGLGLVKCENMTDVLSEVVVAGAD